MKKIIKIILLVLPLITVSFPQAYAAEGPLLKANPMPPVSELVAVPVPLQQRWILRGCEKGPVSYRFSGRFVLMSIPEGSKLFRLGGVKDEGNGRYTMVMPGDITGLMLGSKGNLIQYFGDTKASFSLEDLEAKKIMVPYVSFDNCTTAETIAVKEDATLVSLLPGLDRAQEACATPDDIYKASCQKTFFSLFDHNADDVLDQAELEKAWGIIVGYSPFATCGPLADNKDTLKTEGRDYLAWIFANIDKDKNQKISFAEISSNWKIMQGDPLMSGATNLLIAADKPVGLLPANIRLTCVNCCVAPAKAP